MLVEDLIQELNKLPPKAVVVREQDPTGRGRRWVEVTWVGLVHRKVTRMLRENGWVQAVPLWFGEARPRSRGTKTTVSLD